MGGGYVIEHCIAACNRQRKLDNYEIYVTDSFYMIMKYLNGGNEVLGRYWELIHPQSVDDKDGSDIAEDIIKRHGLKVVG